MVPSRALLSAAALALTQGVPSAYARTIHTAECAVDLTIGNLCVVDSIGLTLGTTLAVAVVGITAALALKLLISLLQRVAKDLKRVSST